MTSRAPPPADAVSPGLPPLLRPSPWRRRPCRAAAIIVVPPLLLSRPPPPPPPPPSSARDRWIAASVSAEIAPCRCSTSNMPPEASRADAFPPAVSSGYPCPPRRCASRSVAAAARASAWVRRSTAGDACSGETLSGDPGGPFTDRLEKDPAPAAAATARPRSGDTVVVVLPLADPSDASSTSRGGGRARARRGEASLPDVRPASCPPPRSRTAAVRADIAPAAARAVERADASPAAADASSLASLLGLKRLLLPPATSEEGARVWGGRDAASGILASVMTLTSVGLARLECASVAAREAGKRR